MMNAAKQMNKFFTLLILVIVVFIVVMFQTTKPLPEEAWTTMYFTNYDEIKHDAVVGTPFFVNFTIENHEGNDSSYVYNVSMDFFMNKTDVGRSDVISRQVFIKKGENQNFSELLTIDKVYDNIKVEVDLYKNNEKYRSIYYFVKIK